MNSYDFSTISGLQKVCILAVILVLIDILRLLFGKRITSTTITYLIYSLFRVLQFYVLYYIFLRKINKGEIDDIDLIMKARLNTLEEVSHSENHEFGKSRISEIRPYVNETLFKLYDYEKIYSLAKNDLVLRKSYSYKDFYEGTAVTTGDKEYSIFIYSLSQVLYNATRLTIDVLKALLKAFTGCLRLLFHLIKKVVKLLKYQILKLNEWVDLTIGGQTEHVTEVENKEGKYKRRQDTQLLNKLDNIENRIIQVNESIRQSAKKTTYRWYLAQVIKIALKLVGVR